MASALLEMRHEKEKTAISPHSMVRLLRELAKQGKFAESNGAFMPCESQHGFSASELATLRLIHDLLLERGVRFERKRNIAVKGSHLELALFSGKKSVLGKIGRERRAVIFESGLQLEEFEKSLGGNSAEDIRIKLAHSNGKLVFAIASRAELNALLL